MRKRPRTVANLDCLQGFLPRVLRVLVCERWFFNAKTHSRQCFQWSCPFADLSVRCRAVVIASLSNFFVVKRSNTTKEHYAQLQLVTTTSKKNESSVRCLPASNSQAGHIIDAHCPYIKHDYWPKPELVGPLMTVSYSFWSTS